MDPAVSRAFKDRYIALTDSWVRGIEFTPAESAAMEAGKKWEPALMQGPDDPLGKKVLAAGETAEFTADWPTSNKLTPGTYTIHGLFLVVLPMGAGARVRENVPPLAIQISG